jgi:hypothetical protein
MRTLRYITSMDRVQDLEHENINNKNCGRVKDILIQPISVQLFEGSVLLVLHPKPIIASEGRTDRRME